MPAWTASTAGVSSTAATWTASGSSSTPGTARRSKLLKHYTPHPNTYFVLGLLSRFTAKHSDVLACRVDGGRSGHWQRVFAAALRSPKGNLTLAVVNDAKTEGGLSLKVRGMAQDLTLYRYGIQEAQRDRAEVRIDPQTRHRLSSTAATLKDRLPPMSLTIYSTYRLAHSDDGVTAE